MKEFNQKTKDDCYIVHLGASFQCEHPECCERSVQVAHSIKKGKTGRAKIKTFWGNRYKEDLKIWSKKMDAIIHHKFNTNASCINHNSWFLRLGNKEKFEPLVERIHDDLESQNGN